MATAWRTELSFSDRLANVHKISFTYRGASSSATPAEAQGEATSVETAAFNEATSVNTQDNQRGDTSVKLDLGSYKGATFYENGLFSAIYKATAPSQKPPDASEVYKPGALVALKLTRPSTMGPPHDSLREARILRYAQGPGIVPLWDSFHRSGGEFVLVFPFLRHDLEELLVQRNLSKEQAVLILRDVFTALAHIHSKGIIHRDVKPSNILIKSLDGPAYLADFGIAWSESDSASEKADRKITDVGTTSYRPPELLFGHQSYTSASDMWAAGCVVAEVVNHSQKPLFESGELGSELTLIHSMFQKLGTPTLDVWPEAAKFRDWGKMQFFRYPPRSWSDLLPHASEVERDLVRRLVCFESGQRLSAVDALRHPYFL
ncbi:protein kinase [Pseudovirgaria hyperparasitica]|uniref:cyclin-dependent kinase n=1 Tax=Pseudovirgaria hyperparasitica TaxID=470096 RepID=A0A6A6VU63_9PEZI|nr:protein kinase [Pseudovirgaria hyperparasitica]KAF2753695.1 protein kinase [Pseudovirgaria hyperparasitica]